MKITETAVAEPLAEAVDLLASGWAIYERGSRAEDVDLLDLGDKRAVRAQRKSRRAAREVERVYNDRDSDLLARYVDFERLARERVRAGL